MKKLFEVADNNGGALLCWLNMVARRLTPLSADTDGLLEPTEFYEYVPGSAGNSTATARPRHKSLCSRAAGSCGAVGHLQAW